MYVNIMTVGPELGLSVLFLARKKGRSKCRMQGHFGPPHLQVSKPFEERGITQ